MDSFEQFLDSCSTVEIYLLAKHYRGFALFAHLLELMSLAIVDGVT